MDWKLYKYDRMAINVIADNGRTQFLRRGRHRQLRGI